MSPAAGIILLKGSLVVFRATAGGKLMIEDFFHPSGGASDCFCFWWGAFLIFLQAQTGLPQFVQIALRLGVASCRQGCRVSTAAQIPVMSRSMLIFFLDACRQKQNLLTAYSCFVELRGIDSCTCPCVSKSLHLCALQAEVASLKARSAVLEQDRESCQGPD